MPETSSQFFHNVLNFFLSHFSSILSHQQIFYSYLVLELVKPLFYSLRAPPIAQNKYWKCQSSLPISLIPLTKYSQ